MNGQGRGTPGLSRISGRGSRPTPPGSGERRRAWLRGPTGYIAIVGGLVGPGEPLTKLEVDVPRLEEHGARSNDPRWSPPEWFEVPDRGTPSVERRSAAQQLSGAGRSARSSLEAGGSADQAACGERLCRRGIGQHDLLAPRASVRRPARSPRRRRARPWLPTAHDRPRPLHRRDHRRRRRAASPGPPVRRAADVRQPGRGHQQSQPRARHRLRGQDPPRLGLGAEGRAHHRFRGQSGPRRQGAAVGPGSRRGEGPPGTGGSRGQRPRLARSRLGRARSRRLRRPPAQPVRLVRGHGISRVLHGAQAGGDASAREPLLERRRRLPPVAVRFDQP